jgi:hypothetical protein
VGNEVSLPNSFQAILHSSFLEGLSLFRSFAGSKLALKLLHVCLCDLQQMGVRATTLEFHYHDHAWHLLFKRLPFCMGILIDNCKDFKRVQ